MCHPFLLFILPLIFGAFFVMSSNPWGYLWPHLCCLLCAGIVLPTTQLLDFSSQSSAVGSEHLTHGSYLSSLRLAQWPSAHSRSFSDLESWHSWLLVSFLWFYLVGSCSFALRLTDRGSLLVIVRLQLLTLGSWFLVS